MVAQLLAAILLLTLPVQSIARAHRSHAELHAFQREHPCPSTGRHRGACPGYVIDHVRPLCAGGPDHRSNMQWQTVADGLTKDRIERRECRTLKRKGGRNA